MMPVIRAERRLKCRKNPDYIGALEVRVGGRQVLAYPVLSGHDVRVGIDLFFQTGDG